MEQGAAAAPAKITDRFLAYLIDTVPFVVGYHATSIYLIAVRQRFADEPANYLRLGAFWLALYLGYHAAGAMAGSTIGKALMGLRVVDAEGASPGLGRALVRAFGLLLSTPLNLGFLWSFVNRDSRTWHDLLAGTYVVEARPKPQGERLATALGSLVTLAGLLLVSFWANTLRPTAEDRDAVARAYEGLSVLAEIQERHREAKGAYGRTLSDLAWASGDVEGFKAAMREIFEPDRFEIAGSESRYRITARAKDRARTPVTISGPPAAP